VELEEARTLLSECTRSELRDEAFEDTEVFWHNDGVEVAGGFFNARAAYITITVNNTYSFLRDDDARSLRECGTLGVLDHDALLKMSATNRRSDGPNT
jgi:hypothetical protein